MRRRTVRGAAATAAVTALIGVPLTGCSSSPPPTSVSAPVAATSQVAARPSDPTTAPATPSQGSRHASVRRAAGVSSDPVGGHNRDVYVVGDSVLLGTVDTLPAALHGWRVTMNCVGSRRLTQAIPILRFERDRLGAVVVIQMGNNYIDGEDGDFGSQMVTAMHLLRHVRRVVWVTVAALHPDRARIDRTIKREAARFHNIRVADWAPIAAAHPGYTYDGLHLTIPGRVAMARLIARTVGPAPHRASA